MYVYNKLKVFVATALFVQSHESFKEENFTVTLNICSCKIKCYCAASATAKRRLHYSLVLSHTVPV